VGPQIKLRLFVSAVGLADYPIRVALNRYGVDDCVIDLELSRILSGELLRYGHEVSGLLLADDRLDGPLLRELLGRVWVGVSGARSVVARCCWRPGPPLSTEFLRLLDCHDCDRLGSTASSGSLFWLIHSVFLVI